MKPPFLLCPNCKIGLPAGSTTCPDCDEDLAPLMRLQWAPYVAYNDGLRLAQAGDLDAALRKIQEAVKVLPDEPDIPIVLGKLYAQKGNWIEARQWWGTALEKCPSSKRRRTVWPR